MKTLIVYYSYSGITKKVVDMYADILRKKGDVTIQQLKPKTEITTFLGQCQAAFLRKRAELEGNIDHDASPYNLIILALPVWAFAPVPAVNTYLDIVTGLSGKRVITILTSGSGAGVNKCFGNIRSCLKAKGANKIDEINVPNRIMGDVALIMSKLEAVLKQ
jgi:flavodoxin